MRQTVIGIFRNSSDAERAAERLRASGFNSQDVDVTTSHVDAYSSDASKDYTSSYDTQDRNTPYNVSDESRYSENRSHDTLNEDRLRERRDSDSGFGDSIGRFFRNLFDSKDDAERYSTIGRSNSIVSVYADSYEEAERAADILDDCGAINVDEHASGSYTDNANYIGATEGSDTSFESRNDLSTSDRDFAASDDNFERADLRTPEGIDNSTSIPVIEENLNVGKREVERGGVRLRSRIFERPVEESLRLREERVRVERTPVNRPATDADFATFREGEIELTESAEVPIVNKEARVVEEVRLTKDVSEREEVVRDNVRKTDVDVENISEETLKAGRKNKSKL